MPDYLVLFTINEAFQVDVIISNIIIYLLCIIKCFLKASNNNMDAEAVPEGKGCSQVFINPFTAVDAIWHLWLIS